MEKAPIETAIQEDGKITSVWSLWFSRQSQALPVYADNAAAIAAGKKTGENYRTATGQVMVVY